MDVTVIFTAIAIGFVFSIVVKPFVLFFRNYRKFHAAEVATRQKQSTVTVRIDEILQPNTESLVLLFDYSNNKFLTQGTTTEVAAFIKEKFKTKNVFVTLPDGSDSRLIKPAELQ